MVSSGSFWSFEGEGPAQLNRSSRAWHRDRVYKPRYDVAYVKIISNVGDREEPIQVLRDPLPVEARIISLVYRPELGGWRVHSLGHPVDPADPSRSRS